MEQDSIKSSQTTKDNLPTGLESLIESLSAHIPGLASTTTTVSSSQTSTIPTCTNDQIPVAANEISRLSDSSGADSSINSIGYAADTSELQQPNESPVKVATSLATPLTPTANLKMLVAAASSAFDREQREIEDTKKPADDGDDLSTSRKMKSLALLCKRFLQVADEEIGPGKEFSLEMIANSLGINRRRIYDIINVLEALEMISKQSKNWYLWHGRGKLLYTLAKLKAMVPEDPDIAPYLESTTKPHNNNNNNSDQAATSSEPADSGDIQVPQSGTQPEATQPQPEGVSPKDRQLVVAEPNTVPVSCEVTAEDNDEQNHYNPTDFPFATRSVRYDKSLGVLCQKFVMLFLVSQDHEVTLEEAGKILVPDYQEDTIYMTLNPPVNPKTKVRRLYDIANILTSLGLIEKKVFVGPLHIKKPGYVWSGPSIEEIDRVLNACGKKQDGSSKAVGNKMKKSISCRPFLHHYDIQGTDVSPYCSPVKALGGSKFKRSLSFGGTTTSTPRTSKMCSTPPLGNGRVLARPLCPKQVDYLREMKEFKSEMDKHAHRYPHVASIFHEFLQKYQSTLEQSGSANGRFILPKTAAGGGVSLNPMDSHPHPPQQPSCTCSTCTTPWDITAQCTSKDVSNCALKPAADAVPITSPTSMQSVCQGMDAPAVACSGQESIPYAMPSNTFVATLANSLLANILETIQNSAQSSEHSSNPAVIQQTQAPIISSVSSGVAPVITNSSINATQGIMPLTEVQNIKDKGVVMLATPPQKSFVHVDDLLAKQQQQPVVSRVRPCDNNINNSSGSIVFGSLNPTTPKRINTGLQISSVNCLPLPTKSAGPAINPNAFLAANNLISEKENVGSGVVYKCTETGPSSEEKSPKRQRIC